MGMSKRDVKEVPTKLFLRLSHHSAPFSDFTRSGICGPPDGGPNVEPDGPKSPPDVGFSTSGLGPAATSTSTLQDMHARRGGLLRSCRWCGRLSSLVVGAAGHAVRSKSMCFCLAYSTVSGQQVQNASFCVPNTHITSHSYIFLIHRRINVSRTYAHHSKKALARSLPVARTRSSSCLLRLPSGIVGGSSPCSTLGFTLYGPWTLKDR